ncbi:MAG: fasciclin domain-containing protein [Sphingomonadaceae bacterium]
MRLRDAVMPLAALALFACEAGEEADEAEAAEASQELPGERVGALIEEEENLSTFARAAETAGLAESFDGPAPYTVFAPSDEAFAALPEGELERLMGEEQRAALTGLVTYHIVPGVILSKDLAAALERGEGEEVEQATLGGLPVTVSKDGKRLVLTDIAGNEARVVAADRRGANGVVHVIDTVLRPETEAGEGGGEE